VLTRVHDIFACRHYRRAMCRLHFARCLFKLVQVASLSQLKWISSHWASKPQRCSVRELSWLFLFVAPLTALEKIAWIACFRVHQACHDVFITPSKHQKNSCISQVQPGSLFSILVIITTSQVMMKIFFVGATVQRDQLPQAWTNSFMIFEFGEKFVGYFTHEPTEPLRF